MTGNVSVELKSVSKIYRVYSNPSQRLWEMLSRGRRVYHASVPALLDIDLAIERGTTFGILGRNGSGKSTLLQIIASVLQPSAGQVRVQGKVSALLELGSGFNPDFTGIENVHLYASILGLEKWEIEEKLQSIIDFSEIGEFVKRPVGTYSSGMIVRLAFSVAVAIEPDILIIDEALSVGDALFQHKCIRRMRQIMESGATVVFVSHDINSVKALCQEAILLEEGRIAARGKASNVANEYHRRLFETEEQRSEPGAGSVIGLGRLDESGGEASLPEGKGGKPPASPSRETLQSFAARAAEERFGSGGAKVCYVEVLSQEGCSVAQVDYGERFTVRIFVLFEQAVSSAVVGFVLRNSRGVDIITANTRIENVLVRDIKAGEMVAVDFSLQSILAADSYSINPAVTHEQYFHQARYYDWVNNALILHCSKPREKIVYGMIYPADMKIMSWRRVERRGAKEGDQ